MIEQKDLHVIILDGEIDRREDLRKLLINLRVGDITEASRVSEIKSDIKSGSKVIVILGDRTPLGTAMETLTALKDDYIVSKTPLLLYTANKNPEYVRSLVAAGLSGVIEEPLDPRQIRAIFRNYVRRHNTAEVASLVKEAAFFNEFNKQELQTLSEVAICRTYAAGETIITKDDPSDRFFVLLKGKVEILITASGSPQLQLEVTPGQCFGEMGLLDNTPRSAFCIAADDAYVLEIGSHIMNDKDFSIRLKILTQMAFVLARRIRNMNSLLEHRQNLKEERERPDRNSRALRNLPRDLVEAVTSPREGRATDKGGERDIATTRDEGAAPAVAADTPETPEVEEDKNKNPFASPSAKADALDERIRSQEEYDVLVRKVSLRTDFILNKIPNAICDVVANKMFSYWTGGKLAKINPHSLWNPNWFTEGTHRKKRSMHLVVLHPGGTLAYDTCYLELPLTHRVIGLSQVGCVGTFLHTAEMIERYFDNKPLQSAIECDLEIGLDRLWNHEPCIEFLTHTSEDVRDDTLFLVFDDTLGNNTARVRRYFPSHQIVTVVQGIGWNPNDSASIFTFPEETLSKQGHLVSKEEYDGHGFYTGETTYLPDFSNFYDDADVIKDHGHIFGTIGVFAKMGPDYSGRIWGSHGGADGAMKAARAMYGIKGAQSSEDLASAINWADG